MHQTLFSTVKLNDKLKKSLINDLKKVESQLFKRVMKLNQKNVFCIDMKKFIKNKRLSHKQ
jgi:hypothetical protein